MNPRPYSSCHLGFEFICSMVPETAKKQEYELPDYISFKSVLIQASSAFEQLDKEFHKAYTAYEFLHTHKVDKGFLTYLDSTYGLEDMTGLPKECLFNGNVGAYTSICMEGLGTVLINIVKRIIEFFKKLYETIMRFLGVKTFRQRKIEGDLNTIKRKVEAMSDGEFHSVIKQNVKCNVMTMRISELDKLIDDVQTIYHLLNSHKDVDNLQSLISATSGMLSKIGHRTENEYKIINDTGLPYQVFEANQTLNIESSFGIKDKATIFSRIDAINRILDSVTDIKRWYPANLQKYATRATSVKIDPNDPESVKLHEASIKKLNEEQKCQAYLCKFIVIYLELVDLLCARAVATLGSVSR